MTNVHAGDAGVTPRRFASFCTVAAKNKQLADSSKTAYRPAGINAPQYP
jgi:hypothetical protein